MWYFFVSSSALTIAEPRKPVPPVTRIFSILLEAWGIPGLLSEATLRIATRIIGVDSQMTLRLPQGMVHSMERKTEKRRLC
jgi:hypothetical protein